MQFLSSDDKPALGKQKCSWEKKSENFLYIATSYIDTTIAVCISALMLLGDACTSLSSSHHPSMEQGCSPPRVPKLVVLEGISIRKLASSYYRIFPL